MNSNNNILALDPEDLIPYLRKPNEPVEPVAEFLKNLTTREKNRLFKNTDIFFGCGVDRKGFDLALDRLINLFSSDGRNISSEITNSINISEIVFAVFTYRFLNVKELLKADKFINKMDKHRVKYIDPIKHILVACNNTIGMIYISELNKYAVIDSFEKLKSIKSYKNNSQLNVFDAVVSVFMKLSPSLVRFDKSHDLKFSSCIVTDDIDDHDLNRDIKLAAEVYNYVEEDIFKMIHNTIHTDKISDVDKIKTLCGSASISKGPNTNKNVVGEDRHCIKYSSFNESAKYAYIFRTMDLGKTKIIIMERDESIYVNASRLWIAVDETHKATANVTNPIIRTALYLYAMMNDEFYKNIYDIVDDLEAIFTVIFNLNNVEYFRSNNVEIKGVEKDDYTPKYLN